MQIPIQMKEKLFKNFFFHYVEEVLYQVSLNN